MTPARRRASATRTQPAEASPRPAGDPWAGPVRVGVIGVGAIGADHAVRLATAIAGATVTAVADADPARAGHVAAAVGGAEVAADGFALIGSDRVDAVLVASTDETHAAFVLACIDAGKPVLCEKPLAPTSAECERILAAEVARGSRLVAVGFMRRFDAGYLEVKATLDGGALGEPLLLHNIHRNRSVGSSYTSAMTMTSSMLHEIDVTRWLLGEEILRVEVIPPKRTPNAAPHLQDPQLACFTTETGIVSAVEFFANCRYGYDVRCELVGSEGTASVVNPVVAGRVTAGAASEAVPPDWGERFGAAYAAELQAWITGLRSGRIVGPSAWDGYAATLVAEHGVEAAQTGRRVAVEHRPKPGLYA